MHLTLTEWGILDTLVRHRGKLVGPGSCCVRCGGLHGREPARTATPNRLIGIYSCSAAFLFQYPDQVAADVNDFLG